jgi:hypothetical protein
MVTGLGLVQICWHSRFIFSGDGPARPGNARRPHRATSDSMSSSSSLNFRP